MSEMRTEKEIREMLAHYIKHRPNMYTLDGKAELKGIIHALEWVLGEKE